MQWLQERMHLDKEVGALRVVSSCGVLACCVCYRCLGLISATHDIYLYRESVIRFESVVSERVFVRRITGVMGHRGVNEAETAVVLIGCAPRGRPSGECTTRKLLWVLS